MPTVDEKKVKSKTRFEALIELIYDLFRPHVELPVDRRVVTYLKANEAINSLDQAMIENSLICSKKMIVAAKSSLGIRSRHLGRGKNSYWIWRMPIHSPAQVMKLKEMNREKQLEARRAKRLEEKTYSETGQLPQRQNRHVEALRQYMLAHSCDVPANDYLAIFHPHSKTLLKKIKGVLHIKSVRRKDFTTGKEAWHWLYPSPAVQEWLLLRLEAICPFAPLMEEAKRLGWSIELIRHARMDIGGIGDCWINGEHCWYDTNRFNGIPPATEEQVRELSKKEKK